MFQIVHDIAPESRLGFATAFAGEVSFADNVRSLAGLPTGSSSKSNFKADVIIDDVIYLDEPMFQDGIIAQAVDDVAAAGVTFFSSASNQPGSQAYDSNFRLVPASSAATAGTNLDFTGIDPALYKGGFHNSPRAERRTSRRMFTLTRMGLSFFNGTSHLRRHRPSSVEFSDRLREL